MVLKVHGGDKINDIRKQREIEEEMMARHNQHGARADAIKLGFDTETRGSDPTYAPSSTGERRRRQCEPIGKERRHRKPH